MELGAVRCWNATIADHALLVQAQRLYENTIAASERIPWLWIERAVIEPVQPRGWHKHLLLATVNNAFAGFAYGSFIPGFGGYLGYISVESAYRQHGVATTLFQEFLELMTRDAKECGEPLPFVLWESHRPGSDAGISGQKLWQARLRFFAAVGGFWIRGLHLQAPNYESTLGPPVPLHVFMRPVEDPPHVFERRRLRSIAAELMRRVYGLHRRHPLYRRTMRKSRRLQLVAPRLATEKPTPQPVVNP